MTAAVETMAWTGVEPWHGLGFKVANNLTPKQMLKAAKLTWAVDKRPLFYNGKNDKPIQIKDRYALVRDTDDRCLTVTGGHWKPVQNEQAVDFFRKFVIAGHMSMETMGALYGGQYIWALARLGADFSLKGGKAKSSTQDDEVRGYLLLCQPHVFGKAMIIQYTSIRVVCWNTLCMALGASMMGDGTGFRMPHSIEFTDRMKTKAEEALGLAKKQTEDYRDACVLLSQTRVTHQQVDEYFCDVLKFDPTKAKKKKVEVLEGAIDHTEPLMLPKLRLAYNTGPGAELATAEGTLWGAVNAVTHVIDHETGRNRSTSLRAGWLGVKAQMKRRAMELAIDRARVA